MHILREDQNLESKYEYEQTMEDEGFQLGLSASLINWGSGSNWRRCLPTKPAAENLSMHCNATHHIWNRGGERGGVFLRSILVYL